MLTLPSRSHLNPTLPAAAQSPSSSEDSNEDDKDSKSEEESDSSDDTFVKDSYYSSSSVWRSYTTRGQVKGNKEGEGAAICSKGEAEDAVPRFCAGDRGTFADVCGVSLPSRGKSSLWSELCVLPLSALRKPRQ